MLALSSRSVTCTVPPELAAVIHAENENFRLLRRLLQTHKNMIELEVYFHIRSRNTGGGGGSASQGGDVALALTTVTSSVDEDKCVLYLSGSTTLSEALRQAFHAFASSKAVKGTTESSLERSRLRSFNPVANRVGETFGGREAMTLNELNIVSLSPSCVLLLERRKSDDPPFIEFNPREMQIRLVVWDSVSVAAGVVSPQFVNISVIVPGEEAATVGGLRLEATLAVGLEASKCKQLVLILNSDRSVLELSDDSKLLKKDHGITSGDEIVIDILPVNATADHVSLALIELRNKKKAVQLFFNNPKDMATTVAYTHSVSVSLEHTLSEVKGHMATLLGMPVGDFHLRRNAAAPQLKDESKLLTDLGIVDQSMLHLQVNSSDVIHNHLFKLEILKLIFMNFDLL